MVFLFILFKVIKTISMDSEIQKKNATDFGSGFIYVTHSYIFILVAITQSGCRRCFLGAGR